MLDVVIFCEGTYPYVSGGVSSWIHALLEGMPDLNFGLVYLAPTRSFKREFKFKIPSNVKTMVEVYIYDVVMAHQKTRPDKGDAWGAVRKFFTGIVDGNIPDFDEIFYYLCSSEESLRALDIMDLAFSRQTWDILTDIYKKKCAGVSFVDFYWTWRFSHYPLFQLLNAEIPQGKVYHTITTGWSGLLATLAKMRYGRPMILTEHGIYTNERRIEIAQADWIYVENKRGAWLRKDMGVLKGIWINLFASVGKLCYDWTDEIYTLYGGNKTRQINDGADASKIRIIPNGVKIDVFEKVDVSKVQKPPGEFTIGFVGRVVPIKDVKTFIKSIRLVVEKVPQACAYIIGPTEEDEEYYQECVTLVTTLGLEQKVIFTGRQDVKLWYPKLDVRVLTSISEGQPQVILEAYCFGVPCVSSDVGSCSEIIFGLDEADKALGSSGFITRVGAPNETADAIIRIARDPELAGRMREAGRQRVRKYYAYNDMIDRYHEIYQRYVARPTQPPKRFALRG
ncbi:MAG: GT4 family glycosyltransferase PelF [Candidatus Xenobia bacterium]